jgi:hypothetical protein
VAEQRPARRIDVVGVVLALVLLTVASVGLTGDPWWFLQSAVKWVIAGAIALIGLGLLLGSLPGRSGHRRP